MAYLKTKEAVRAYIDSNSGQFARAGNPWDGKGELRPKGARPAKPKPAPVRPGPRALIGRSDCETFLDAQCALDMAARIAAFRGKSRTARPIHKPLPPIVDHIVRDKPLDPLSSEAIAAEGAKLAARHAAAMAEMEQRHAHNFTALANAFAEAMAD